MSGFYVNPTLEGPAHRNNRTLRVLAACALLIPPAGALPAPGEGPAAAKPPRIITRHPEGGLAYRLTISAEATPEHPHRLIVWLHPSGGLYNAHVEGLAPVMMRQGFALMVMTDKDPRGWTFDDARMLLGVNLPDVGSLPGVDLRRPILMGFSAGGQVALELWRTKPELYGGVIVDAAYPADTVDGEDVVFAPPQNPAIEDVPMLVYVGEKDRLLWVWEKVAAPWREVGVPLEVHVVPELGHQWLLLEDQVPSLEAWLSRLPSLDDPADQVVAPPQEEPAPAEQP